MAHKVSWSSLVAYAQQVQMERGLTAEQAATAVFRKGPLLPAVADRYLLTEKIFCVGEGDTPEEMVKAIGESAPGTIVRHKDQDWVLAYVERTSEGKLIDFALVPAEEIELPNDAGVLCI